MKVIVELPAPVAGALLRYAEDKGFSSIAGAIGHLLIICMSQAGYF